MVLYCRCALFCGNPFYEILNLWSQIFRKTLFYNKNPHSAQRHLVLSHLQTYTSLFLPRQMAFFPHRSYSSFMVYPSPHHLHEVLHDHSSPMAFLLLLIFLVFVAWLFIWYLSHLSSLQWCAGRCLRTGSLEEGGEPWFVALANFCSVNTPAKVSFKPVTWCDSIQSWEEVCLFGFLQLVPAASGAWCPGSPSPHIFLTFPAKF